CLQRIPGQSTGRYSAIMDNTGELFIGLSDVGVAEHLDPALPGPCEAGEPGRALLMDANLSETCLQALSERAASLGLPTAAMSVSPAKSVRLLSIASELQLLFCNRREAIALADPRLPVDTDLDVLADTLLARGFNQFVLTDADSPVLVQTPSLRERLSVPTFTRTEHVNGAGDALAGASFAAWCTGSDLPDAVRRQGLPAAARILSGQRQPPCLLAGLKHIDTGT
ncbi:MAG: hypothetical protein HKN42_09580, partial [Granulosicoccus sp.]|nr:hypothetical protein [Granulosicoccus sp.]